MKKFVGVVRKIDFLGRIVIPKELRNTMLIKENDPMEIMMENLDGVPAIVIRQYQGQSVTELHLRALANAAVSLLPGRLEEYNKALERIASLLEESDC